MSDALSQNIADSIVADSTGMEMIADIGEFTIDQLLADGLLKDIPWVGWIFRAKGIYSSISDRILLAKIVKFLLQLHSQSEVQRAEILEQLRKSSAERRRIGQYLLIVIERLDDLEKPALIAQCFSAYLQGLLSFREFSQLADAVTKCHATDLSWFYAPFPRINLNPPYERLFISGLARFKKTQAFVTRFEESRMSLEFEISELGNLLQDVMAGRLSQRPDARSRQTSNLGSASAAENVVS
jgi:hypothetical protein